MLSRVRLVDSSPFGTNPTPLIKLEAWDLPTILTPIIPPPTIHALPTPTPTPTIHAIPTLSIPVPIIFAPLRPRPVNY